MPKLKIDTNCPFSPDIRVKNVPNPHLIYPELKKILVDRIEINSEDINEKMYEHTKLDGKEKIEAVIESQKFMDKITVIQYKIKLKIEMKAVNKDDIKYVGDVNVKIESRVRTSYPQDTKFQKSILGDAFRAFYDKTLYNDMKEQYMDKCKGKTGKLRDEIQSFFNLLPKMNK